MIREIFDTHCHYDDHAFDEDRDELLGEILGQISGVIHAAIDIKSSNFGIENSLKYETFYTSVGIHPESLENLSENYIEELENLLKSGNSKIVAIGEIGLDYHYEGFDKAKQIEVFETQLLLANKYNLPVIVHLRDATEDGMELLKKHKPKGVLHCFSGSAETAKEVVKLGMYISFTGVLTFKNSKKAKKACEAVPIDRLLLETDCPYMAPEPFRGKRCDSRMIEKTATAMGEIKGVSTEEMLKTAKENARTLFGVLN